MASENTFWLVWSPSGEYPPRHKHETEHLARMEAERLARADREAQFYVLRAVALYQLDDLRVTELTDDEEPPF